MWMWKENWVFMRFRSVLNCFLCLFYSINKCFIVYLLLCVCVRVYGHWASRGSIVNKIYTYFLRPQTPIPYPIWKEGYCIYSTSLFNSLHPNLTNSQILLYCISNCISFQYIFTNVWVWRSLLQLINDLFRIYSKFRRNPSLSELWYVLQATWLRSMYLYLLLCANKTQIFWKKYCSFGMDSENEMEARWIIMGTGTHNNTK